MSRLFCFGQTSFGFSYSPVIGQTGAMTLLPLRPYRVISGESSHRKLLTQDSVPCVSGGLCARRTEPV